MEAANCPWILVTEGTAKARASPKDRALRCAFENCTRSKTHETEKVRLTPQTAHFGVHVSAECAKAIPSGPLGKTILCSTLRCSPGSFGGTTW